MAIAITTFKTIELECTKCKGQCWDKNQAKRQANARAMFGTTPNSCVDSELDGPKCPYRP